MADGGWKNADVKMRLTKCGWKNADGKMRMIKCGRKIEYDKIRTRGNQLQCSLSDNLFLISYVGRS